MTSRRVVVTGVAGFIGSHLAEALLDRGDTVVGVDRRGPGADPVAAENLNACHGRPGFTFVEADLLAERLEPLFAGATAICHLAAIPGTRPSWGERFAEYASCNIWATHRVVAAAEATAVPRVVVASSSSVYGQNGRRPLREDGPVAPLSPYGVTKLAAEQLCLAHARRPDAVTSVVALRYFTVYGPRQRPDMLIGRALRAALGGQGLTIHGDGSQRRDFTYVGDVVRATVAATTVAAIAEVVNVGAGANASVSEVLDTVARLTGRPVCVTYTPQAAGDASDTLADPAKAHTLLGWRPAVPLAAGIASQLSWLSGDRETARSA